MSVIAVMEAQQVHVKVRLKWEVLGRGRAERMLFRDGIPFAVIFREANGHRWGWRAHVGGDDGSLDKVLSSLDAAMACCESRARAVA